MRKKIHADLTLLWKLLRPFALVFMGLQTLTRVSLTFFSGYWHDITFLQAVKIFSWGALFDLTALGGFLTIIIFIESFFKPSKWSSRQHRIIRGFFFALFTYLWIFTALSEHIFWEEFFSRFNFIAVDYLVYTQEVIGNVMQSYPVIPLLLGILCLTAAFLFFFRKTLFPNPHNGKNPLFGSVIVTGVFALFLAFSPYNKMDFNNDDTARELASNGIYDLFHAFRHNELEFKSFYKTEKKEDLAKNIRALLAEDEMPFASADPMDWTRIVKNKNAEIHKNVIFIVMESMSGDFMGVFGNKKGLTPNLDRLTREGLFFPNLYATGTRTVRGLEALTLSIPPTPGQSILRRQGNENLFSLGFIFQDRGYDTAFIYGGHGYFDNMNYFFANNGFRTVDRTDIADENIHFENIWGICDEDLFDEVFRQANAAYAKKQPFMHMVMTTSNHRPYTYPDGRIDIPSKTGGRHGGVKYADYAIGYLIKEAQKKPWFKDTVFVIVSDHTAGAGGKVDLDPAKYHIPAIIYAPGFVQSSSYTQLASQIDLPPTLLGLLHFSYYTKFFGEDLLQNADKKEHPHTFISNYQKVALIQNGQVTVLEPVRKASALDLSDHLSQQKPLAQNLSDTITYYQFASDWRKSAGRIETRVKR